MKVKGVNAIRILLTRISHQSLFWSFLVTLVGLCHTLLPGLNIQILRMFSYLGSLPVPVSAILHSVKVLDYTSHVHIDLKRRLKLSFTSYCRVF